VRVTDRVHPHRRGLPRRIESTAWAVALAAIAALMFSRAAVLAPISARNSEGELLGAIAWTAAALTAHLVTSSRDDSLGWPNREVVAASCIAVTALAIAVVVWAPAGAARSHLLDVVAVTAIGEEAIFRGVVWTILARRSSGWSSRARSLLLVLATSVAFALAHLQYHGFDLDGRTLAQIAYTVPAGLVFGLLRLRTGGILWPALTHSAANSLLKILAAV
jgi:membrane protease YdiL (CAAX protease family)